jgi:hypothetical protein
VESLLPIILAMDLEFPEPEECEHGAPLHMFDRLLVPLGVRPRSMYCAECATLPINVENVDTGANPIGVVDWFVEP